MDKKDKVVQFAHRTVLQLCLSEMVRKSQGLDPFHLRLAEASCYIGELCVASLSFSDFETAMISRWPEREVLDAGVLPLDGPVMMPGILGLAKARFDLPYRLRGRGKAGKPLTEIDYSKSLKLFRDIRQRPAENILPAMADRCRLLGYLVDNWGWHTKWLNMNKNSTWDFFTALVLHKNPAFDFRGLGPNKHCGPYGCQSCDSSNIERYEKALPFTSLIYYAAKSAMSCCLNSLTSARPVRSSQCIAHTSRYMSHF